MKNLEFFTDPFTGEAMYRKIGEPIVRVLMQENKEIIEELLAHSRVFYPEQFKALEEAYKKSSLNKSYYDFLRARRIANCCFGENDSQADLDENGNRNFERVKCPIMAECKYYKIICQPKFNSKLSERELQVMEGFFNQEHASDIAERLYLSINTVLNHKRNVFKKLKIHSMAEYQDYAHRNNLYKL